MPIIAIEGVDGCGKTTQLELLSDWFAREGVDHIHVAEPSNWYRSQEQVRRFLDEGTTELSMESIALLAASDRLMQFDMLIKPALALGKWVVMSRSKYSSFAYMGHRGVDPAFTVGINRYFEGPDVLIYLKIDAATARERIKARGIPIKFEERDEKSLASIIRHFEATLPPSATVIDATLDAATIHGMICERVGLQCANGEEAWRRA